MRRLTAVLLLMLTLAACAAGGAKERPPEPQATPPPPEPAITGRRTSSLSCDGTEVRFPATISGLSRDGSFGRLDSLTRPLKVQGRIWSNGEERMYVGVACGVRTVEQFVTLVARSTLTAYKGRPALRWITRTGVHSFLWLERPGTAVYVGATPGLATEIKPICDAVTSD
ncbi:hypothetical protein [Nonomuraea insulae]|uniref:Lipoprotein LprB n=1 Tax=Nonomuraea insulae TaxID=1616787 RepID=A0ABW1CHW8_9ACTN